MMRSPADCHLVSSQPTEIEAMDRKPLTKYQAAKAFSWIVFLVFVGCGGNPASVTGLVTIDGEPLERGKVGFTPTSGGMKATGKIDSSGYYELRTNRESGLQVGEYEATVISTEPGIVEPGGGPPMPGKSLIPKRYGRTRTSELRFSVTSGANTINIELSSEGMEQDGSAAAGGRR